MHMKASEVGDWLRKCAGKRHHRELRPEDYVVLRPGPNFRWLMGDSAAGQSTPSGREPEPDPASHDSREDDSRPQ
jgi:hypothetical protein